MPLRPLLLLTILIAVQSMHAQIPNSDLGDQIKQLEREEDLITPSRKQALRAVAQTLGRQLEQHGQADVVFVCTHNSRRSQLAELWLRAAAGYYEVPSVAAYSGGTAATAFNKRMVNAVLRFGFSLSGGEEGQNPIYWNQVGADESSASKMFSKKYDDPFNPQTAFVAVMVCAEADKDCPFVPGADARISLPYEDPKRADDTPEEQRAYGDKVREIGREMLYVIKSLKEL